MNIIDLIDECQKVLGSIYVNASIFGPEEIMEKIEEANQTLINIRQVSRQVSHAE